MRIEELIDQNPKTAEIVRTALNILMESPYFYKTDDETIFLFVQRYRQAFAAFFEKCYGWTLVIDTKCARLYKPKWFNEKITEPNRDMFRLTHRDDCIAFLLLLEFFEKESREQGVAADDRENLRIRFGDWLEHAAARFRELLPSKRDYYTDEKVRQILRALMPELEKYRFLRKEKPPAEEKVGESDAIWECLPALWHYQATQLAESFGAIAGGEESQADEANEEGSSE